MNIQKRLKNGEQDPILNGQKLFIQKWTVPLQETTCCSCGETITIRNNQRRS